MKNVTLKIVLPLLFCLISSLAYSQKECGTTLTKENQDYLARTKVQRDAFRANTEGPYHIPVQFHIIRKTDGTGGVNYQDIRNELLTITNSRYALANMIFF